MWNFEVLTKYNETHVMGEKSSRCQGHYGRTGNDVRFKLGGVIEDNERKRWVSWRRRESNRSSTRILHLHPSAEKRVDGPIGDEPEVVDDRADRER